MTPGSAGRSFKNSLSDRYHPELHDAKVRRQNVSFALFELTSRLTRRNGWGLIERRNKRFEDFALSELSRIAKATREKSITVFAYSYTASKLFRFARDHSWRTVLGQIDPGPMEERMVRQLHEAAGEEHVWKPAPTEYWDDWRSECELADSIVVNSDWSRKALLDEGVAFEKVTVVPLAYESSREALSFRRTYPQAFSKDRPLKVLFLGQVNLRKGIRELITAAQMLAGEPIEFRLVGPVQSYLPISTDNKNSIKLVGVVPRSEASEYYKFADVFVFPTHSDGFGLTQLEAQSWKLPIVASRNCGQVVQDGINGLVLSEVSAEQIATTLLKLLRAPENLQRMSDQSGVPERCSLASLSSALCRTGC